MKKFIGLWIDHARCHIVLLNEKEEHIVKIESLVDGNHGSSASHRFSDISNSADAAFEGKIQERRKHQLHRYYQDIIHSIKEADRIFIFGPGEAKTELEKEIKKIKEFQSKILTIESTDKMSDNQIVAKIRQFFKPYL